MQSVVLYIITILLSETPKKCTRAASGSIAAYVIPEENIGVWPSLAVADEENRKIKLAKTTQHGTQLGSEETSKNIKVEERCAENLRG